VEAEDGMKIQKGTVYLAPGGLHMVINRNRIQLLDTPKVHSVRPAIDPMFKSAIETYGENILAVILTGMGKDGAEGCVAVKNAGGYVIAQDEESCVVYGMPKAAVETGAVDEVLSIYDIIVEINKQIEGYK
ncbi:MAG TPA: CheB methylesterase domain-containing protein, partial [Atopostipes sp.]|nr:CheB methylesterase domain-containing protein [Atopostipes sp.]